MTAPEVCILRRKLLLSEDGPEGWFPAQHAGRCRTCGEPFEVGAAIHGARRGGWEAECCA